ncbi:NRPS [Pyricularia oryzae]|uniref:NRPS n=1 Tax=Pyricularia grisea TaxID=148305 RepID=A0ABQ8NSQ2_PYRGI|nr:NRPS [Pyricularia grisea]KAI6310429.1 NRPS [Pyricularia oryzae]KAI6381890.1 NRPS [Pyricularia oryzae]
MDVPSDDWNLASKEPSLSILNPVPKLLPGPSLLHNLISAVARHDDASAIHHYAGAQGATHLSYHSLHQRSNLLAARITAAVAGDTLAVKQLIVPVLLPQSPELYVALLAILKAGGAFCPLNLDAPPERVRFILEDVSARVVITSQTLANVFSEEQHDVKVIKLGSDWDDSSLDNGCDLSDSLLHRAATPSDLAYVMYTSGSTGTPKGVGVSHAAATQSLLAHDEHIPHFRRFLQFAAPTFDVSVFEIFFPLFRGVTLVSCDRRLMLDDLPAVLRQMEVDACELTPTVAGSLLRKRENAPGLKLLLTIGEMLTGPVVQEFGGGGEGQQDSILWAMYGPTEASIHCTLQPAVKPDMSVNCIGFPLSTVSAYIVAIQTEDDEQNQLSDGGLKDPTVLPVGEIGELVVGGYQLAEGYLNRPEQTASAFIDSKTYGRLYRTGDKARLRADGLLECLGRISDGQVKLRGQRMELGEVEAAILRAQGCHGAVAAVVNGSILVAFCLLDSLHGEDHTSAEPRITKACEDWLPKFMVPNEILVLDEFPRLPSGKVDRKGMVAAYEQRRRETQVVASVPEYQSSVEQRLCQLAEESLGVAVEPSLGLSSAGLDSLTAIKLASKIRASGFQVETLQVLQSKSIRHLAQLVRQLADGRQETEDQSEIEVSRPISEIPWLVHHAASQIQEVICCTPIQESMLAETARNSDAYCNWIELDIAESCSTRDVVKAVQKLAQANEVLRTGFAQSAKGQFLQIIWKQLECFDQSTDEATLTIPSGEDLRSFMSYTIRQQESSVRLTIKLHHALYDGWSMDIFVRDLNLALQGADLRPSSQYSSVVKYYNSPSYNTAKDNARQFWAGQLLGYQPSAFPILVTSRSPGPSGTKSDTFTIDVDPDRLRNLARDLEIGSQILFEACIIWVWSLIIGSSDVVIGTVTSGRTLPIPGVEDIMGPCLASVPTRAKLSDVRTVKELLSYLQATNRAMLPHSILPLAEIRKTSGLLPSQSLYDLLFVYQESLLSTSNNNTTSRVKQVAHQDYLETKLLFEVEPRPSDFLLRITYHTDAVPDNYIPVLAEQVRWLIHYMVENPDASMTCMRDALPSAMASRHNIDPLSYQGCADLARMVEETATKFPDMPAVCFADMIPAAGDTQVQTVTYQELNRQANRIAHLVIGSKVMPGMTVAIIMEKSISLYAGILGILKAGCAYLPLLPSTPLQRIETILGHSEAAACLCDASSIRNLRSIQTGCQFLDISKEEDLIRYPDSNPDITPDASRVANIIYTSGSTGIPKGVCVTQLNIMSNLDVLSRLYPLSKGTDKPGRLLQSCSQAFDVSVFEIFYAWKMGMCLCSAVNDTLFADLENAIRALRITHLSMTPTVAALVQPKNVPGVEFLVTSGEPMTEAVASKWAGILYQGYGPSETTNICTVKKMKAGDVIQHLGFAFENTSSFVVHKESRNGVDLVPFGCVGELCFGGDQVVQGYLGMPELTREKFVEHPEYGRLYRSGDLGRMLPDGSLVISGRVDDQIKLRGQRIELKEIDSVTRESESVNAAVTILVSRGTQKSDQLATFYVPLATAETEKHAVSYQVLDDAQTARPAPESQAIFHLLTSRLPTYMIPNYLIPISVIPTTPSGKVDKARLRDTFAQLDQETLGRLSAMGGATEEVEEQWSELETAISRILATVLQIEQMAIRRWTPFPSLGLDSISAISVAKQLRDLVGAPVPVSQVLKSSCVARLGQMLETSSVQSTSTKTIRFEAQFFDKELLALIEQNFKAHQDNTAGQCAEIDAILPCTPLQQGMLAASQATTASMGASYVNQMVLKLAADPKTMRSAWDTMVERHPILRTCFITTNSSRYAMAQVVIKRWKSQWHMFNDGESLDDCLKAMADGLAPPLDSFVPPASLGLARHDGRNTLIFTCHHALYDGTAIAALLDEVEQFIQVGSLPPLPTSYEPFLREMLSLPDSTDNFWKQQLSNFIPKTLPISGKSTEGPGAVSHVMGVSLETANNRLKELGFSLLAVCQASWAMALGIILDEPDVCFGNVTSGRSVPIDGIEKLVAPCFNTIPVRADLSGLRRNMDLVKLLQDSGIEALQYQFTPLRRIQSLNASSNGATRLFDSIMLLQQPSQPLNPDIWSLERDEGSMDVPLVCEAIPEPRENTLVLKMHYDGVAASSPMASFIVQLFSHIFCEVLSYPSAVPLTQDALPDALRQQLEALGLQRSIATSTPKSDQNQLPIAAENYKISETESSIRSILANLATVPKSAILPNTTIFQLGLDSISAVQIASALRQEGFHVSSIDVMDHPTYSALAEFLDQAKTRDSRSANPSYDLKAFQTECAKYVTENSRYRDTVEAILPCTPLQQAMLSEFINSDGSNYLNFLHLRLGDKTTASTDDVFKAFKNCSGSFEMLRTGFIPIEHKHASFAMIRYCEWAGKVTSVPREAIAEFSVDRWRSEVKMTVYNNLDQPPWEAVILEGEAGIEVHLAIHHVLYDAQSLKTILDSLAPSAAEKRPAACNESVDVAIQEIISRSRVGKEDAETYWRSLATETVINRFPVMTPLRVEERSICVESHLSKAKVSLLESSLRKEGVTMQAAIQGAWTRILSSYLGESCMVFGTVLSGRSSGATRSAVFPCITTLPVVAENKSLNRSLVESMMERNKNLHRHQQVPMTQIQNWLGLPETRLFDTLVVYQKLQDDAGQGALNTWEVIEDKATVDYPLSLEIEPRGEHLHYQLTFFSDLLPQHQSALLLRQFDAVLTHLALEPEGCEDELWTGSPSLFSITPAAEPELPSNVRLLHQFVEEAARRYPQKTALEFVSALDGGDPVSRTWNFAELDQNGNRVANILAPCTKVGGIVAILFDKCPEAYFAILGILKSGCSFVALDPAAPAARRQFIIEDSGASALVTDMDRASNLDIDVSVPVVGLDDDFILSSPSTPLTDRQAELSPQDRSYCLYTSGTTGTPKGCEITHENAVQAMLAFQDLFSGHWDQDSKWLQFASFHFDVSVLEQYWSWSVGIALVAAPKDLILEDLITTISSLQITHIDLTPSLARLVHPDDVPSLCKGMFITGGEQLKQEILDAWGDQGVIYNAYGPTEATIGVTMYQRVPRNGRASNIGKQFLNVGSYVFKPGTEIPTLRGGIGELCVSGKLVGKGYLNRKDLTAERFPTLEHFDERVYRTGDLVRILHDGCFDFLGRADDQVKLRGQRLEIGEINHAIKTGISQVQDVATLVIRDESKQKDFLVSFVVADDQSDSSEAQSQTLEPIFSPHAATLARDVQDACRAKLPGYMVPTYILKLPFMPLSSNNKAEVKMLRSLFSRLTQDQLVAASSAGSRTAADLNGDIARILIGTLGNMQFLSPGQKPTADVSIFELGIDSISVLRLSRALKRGGLAQATPALILKNPVLGDLVRALQSEVTANDAGAVLEARQLVEACQHLHRSRACRALGVSSEHIEYIAPCSALQHGMAMRCKTEEHRSTYFNVFTFELRPDVDIARLKSSWQIIVDSFAILRSKFLVSSEGFVQVALKEMQLPWTELETADDELESKLLGMHEQWLDRNSQNLTSPLELLLVKTAGKNLLRLHIFHGLYDANSLGMMIAKVAALYLGTEDIESRTTFIDALIHGPLRNFNHTKTFWEHHLSGVSLQNLPQLSERPSSHDIELSRTLSFAPLEPVRQRLNVTHSAVIQALWLSVLQPRYAKPLTLGVIVFGRAIDVENAEHVVGPLFNTLPFHSGSCTSGSGTWASLVRTCHSFNTATLPFQHVPLRDIQKWCSGGRPLFDTLFSCQREPLSSVAAAEQLWTEVSASPAPISSDYPLAFEATLARDDRLELLLVAQKGFADEHVLSAMLDEFEHSMAMIAGNMDAMIGSSDGGLAPEIPSHEVRDGQATFSQAGLGNTSFEWTDDASLIRNEVAALAGVSPEEVSESTSLLELGLDSIDTIKLSARLKKNGIVLTNSQLVKGQTIARFTETLGQVDKANNTSTSTTAGNDAASKVASMTELLRKHIASQVQNLDLDQVQTVLPPTPLQDAMVADMFQSGMRRYFNHDVLELPPNVDMERLGSAWQSVVDHSPILRTTFIEVESPEFDFAYCQVVHSKMQLSWSRREVASQGEFHQVIESIRRHAEETAGSDGLFKVTPVWLGQQRFIVLSIAHALYDGWSLELLLRDVQDAYNGDYSPRPEYLDYLGHILESATEESKDFWIDTLTGAYATNIQPRKLQLGSRKANDGTKPRETLVHRAELKSAKPAAELSAFCRRRVVSPQVVGQVCWAAVLSRRVQSLDVTFGCVLSGRETESAESLLFPTMNTVAVRAVLHGTIGSLLRYFQETMAGVLQYQHFPLRKAQRLGGSRTPDGLFNTLFVMQKQRRASRTGPETGDLLMTSVDGTSAVEYPVCIEMEIVQDSVIWRTACSDDFLGKQDTEQLLRELDQVLAFLTESSPDLSVFRSTTSRPGVAGSDILVCGLDPFRLKAQNTASSTTAMSSQTDASTLIDVDSDEEWTDAEQKLRTALAEVSGLPQNAVKRSYNLYNIGLDSISAIKVSSLLRKVGVQIRVKDLLRAESLVDMAKMTGSAEQAALKLPQSAVAFSAAAKLGAYEPLVVEAGLDEQSVQCIIPATAMQAHMISLWQKTDGAVFFPEFHYQLPAKYNDLTLGSLQQGWRDMVAELTILRTVFLATTNRDCPFVQVVLLPNTHYQQQTLSLGDNSGPVQSGVTSLPMVYFAAEREVEGSADRPWIITIKLHHSLYDAFSLQNIVRRYGELLAGRSSGELLPVPDYTGNWNARITSEASQELRSSRQKFWVDYLQGATSLPFAGIPASLTSQAATDAKARVSKFVPGAVTAISDVQSECARRGVSFQALFIAAAAAVISAPAPADGAHPNDLVLGIYLGNRDDQDSDQLPYHPTLSLVPLRVRRASGRSLFGAAAEVQRDLHKISDAGNAAVGLWEIQDWTGLQVDCFVNFLGSTALDEQVEDRLKLPEPLGEGKAMYGVARAGAHPQNYHWLGENTVIDAFKDAVDIEAAFGGKDSLDIGVFGPEGMLKNEQGATHVISRLVEVINALGRNE